RRARAVTREPVGNRRTVRERGAGEPEPGRLGGRRARHRRRHHRERHDERDDRTRQSGCHPTSAVRPPHCRRAHASTVVPARTSPGPRDARLRGSPAGGRYLAAVSLAALSLAAESLAAVLAAGFGAGPIPLRLRARLAKRCSSWWAAGLASARASSSRDLTL